MHRSLLRLTTLAVILLISACAPAAAPAAPAAPTRVAAPTAAPTASSGEPTAVSADSSGDSAAAPSAPNGEPTAAPTSQAADSAPTSKVLTVIIRSEPSDLLGLGPSGTTTAAAEVKPIFHDALSRRDERGQVKPLLANDLPSVERGTWRVLPDGGMVMTWNLKPNITWQDGAPFTSADIAFTYAVRKDSEATRAGNGPGHIELISAVETPDPMTVVVRWSSAYYDAAESSALDPLPKHLLDGLDRSALMSSPLVGDQVVGLGPYRLVEWQRGSQMTFTRYDSYFRGRPTMDRVMVRFVADPTDQIAAITDGAADVVIPAGMDPTLVPELKERWFRAGNEALLGLTGRLNLLEPQLRPEAARPRNGFTNLQVRQAFYGSLDRQTLAESITNKIAPPADSWIRPDHPLRKEVETAIPQYPFDIFQAGRLLEFAGWSRGPDGMLANTQTGEPFAFEVWGRPGSDRITSEVADAWTATGAQTSATMIPPERANDRRYEAQRPGLLVSQVPERLVWERHLHSRDVPTPANNWTGANGSGYSNAQIDEMIDRLAGAIDPGGQVAYQRQLLFAVMGDLPIMPLYWDVAPAMVRKGVKALIVPGAYTTANIFDWDKDPE